MYLSKTEKTAVFIDGSNLFAVAKALDFDVDYRKFLKYFQDNTCLVRAAYYTVLTEDQDYSPLRPLVDWLDYNGFHMVTKSTREFIDNQGRKKVKGSIAVDLVIDALAIADKIDHMILFSGDSDFVKLTQALQNKGVRVTIVSTIMTQPFMVGDDLRRQADIFMDLYHIQDNFKRAQSYRAQQQDDDQDDEAEPYSDAVSVSDSGIDCDDEL